MNSPPKINSFMFEQDIRLTLWDYPKAPASYRVLFPKPLKPAFIVLIEGTETERNVWVIPRATWWRSWFDVYDHSNDKGETLYMLVEK